MKKDFVGYALNHTGNVLVQDIEDKRFIVHFEDGFLNKIRKVIACYIAPEIIGLTLLRKKQIEINEESRMREYYRKIENEAAQLKKAGFLSGVSGSL